MQAASNKVSAYQTDYFFGLQIHSLLQETCIRKFSRILRSIKIILSVIHAVGDEGAGEYLDKGNDMAGVYRWLPLPGKSASYVGETFAVVVLTFMI